MVRRRKGKRGILHKTVPIYLDHKGLMEDGSQLTMYK